MIAQRIIDHQLVQRASPYGPTEPKRKLLLRFEQIHPVIRIAHIHAAVLEIPERIIYDHELMLALSGTTTLHIGGRMRAVEPGTLLFLPPFIPHSFQPPPGRPTSTHLAVHFDFCPHSPRQLDESEGPEPYEVVWPGGARLPAYSALAPGHWISQSLREVVASHADADDPLGAIEASARLTRVLTQLLRWGARAGSEGASDVVAHVNHERMARVLAHIAGGLASPLTLEELAAVADVGRSRFVTLFREATGGSPQQYIQQRRIAEARLLLADPSLPIKQIAAMTGFDDRFYFSKVFRRVDGLTPTQFRAAVLFGRSSAPEDEFSS